MSYPHKSQPWTADEDRKLKEMAVDSVAKEEIAAKLKRKTPGFGFLRTLLSRQFLIAMNEAAPVGEVRDFLHQ